MTLSAATSNIQAREHQQLPTTSPQTAEELPLTRFPNTPPSATLKAQETATPTANFTSQQPASANGTAQSPSPTREKQQPSSQTKQQPWKTPPQPSRVELAA